MPVDQLKEYLDEHGIHYVSVEHSPAYTAKEIAERINVKGDQMAKTVMVNLDGCMSMVVLPASCRIRWDRFMKAMGTELVCLASEEEFQDRFPNCEVGAMPPFGNLYDMPTYMYEGFDEEGEIAFRAGTHHEVIKMDLTDYMRLAHPMTLTEGFAKIGVKKPEWLTRRKVS
ncbi:MAG: YbaK/EbsC family protein [Oleiphilaceae bacterium]|nr:YbaK/EbsC family protein [Oleiphilaceae bacterium]